MKTNEILSGMESLTQHYREELDRFSMEDLRRKPSEEEWSLGQVYLHLINSALYVQFANVERCRDLDDNAVTAAGEKNDKGKAVFAQGGIPPIRIQVPASPQYTPKQPENKEQLAEGLAAVVRRMKELAPMLESLSPNPKVEHPGFGHLNAKEWFALVEMHYRHHHLQKDRLKAILQ